MTTTVEFAVQISCDSCVAKIESSLKDVQGVKNIKISKENGTVLVESNLPSTMLQEKIESTGRKAVLKGYGSDKGEREEFNFVKVEVDSSGCCAICKPSPSDSANNMLDLGKQKLSSPTLDKSNNSEVKKEENESNAKSGSANTPPKNLSKSDDEEELELKYSSDSEDGDIEARLNAFNTTEGDDIWKIEDDLDADFDVIDADGDESETEDKNTAGGEKDEKDNPNDSNKVNRTNSQTSINAADSDNENFKSDDIKLAGKKRKLNNACHKFMTDLKASKVRKGDFNVFNTHIALHILILPKKEGEHLEESEAQTIKDNIVKEVFMATQQVLNKEPEAFIPRFSDCKIVKPGWLLINCENKETFNWLSSWEVPPIHNKTYRVVSALDKSPLQTIKFCIKSKWIPDGETMLKLIHLQNRDIDTKRWVLDEKKSVQNGMEQFKYMVDFGSVRALEKLNWSFFYELFAVKVIEYNGKPVTPLLRNKKSKNIST